MSGKEVYTFTAESTSSEKAVVSTNCIQGTREYKNNLWIRINFLSWNRSVIV